MTNQIDRVDDLQIIWKVIVVSRIFILASISAVALLGAGCASDHASSRVASAAFLQAPAAQDAGRDVALKLGQSALVWGDKHTATNLFTRAEQENSTPLNRFNLAAAHQQAGRTGDAMELYATVVLDGKETSGRSLNPANDRQMRTRHFNLAEESKARIDAIVDRARSGPTAATGDDISTPLTAVAAAALDARENPLPGAVQPTPPSLVVAAPVAADQTPG